MASDAMFDFDAEHGKLLAKLKVFTDVIDCRKLLEENELTIADLKRTIESDKDEATTLETEYRTKLKELKAEWNKCELAWEKQYFDKPVARPVDESFMLQMYIHDIPDFVNRSVQGAKSYESFCRGNVLEDDATVEFMQAATKAIEARHALYLLEAAVAKCSVDLASKNQAVKKEQGSLAECMSKDEIDKLKLAAAQEAWEVEYGKAIAVESMENASPGSNVKQLELNATIKDKAAADEEVIEERIKDAVKVAVKKVRDELVPLANVGRRVRRRHRERCKGECDQDKAVIDEGDRCAHYGEALADALTFGDTEEDRAWFLGTYGVRPVWMLKRRQHPNLMEMYDMKGGLAEYDEYPENVLEFKKQFRSVLQSSLTVDKNGAPQEVGCGDAANSFEALKTLYNNMYEMRRAGRQRGRRSVRLGDLGV